MTWKLTYTVTLAPILHSIVIKHVLAGGWTGPGLTKDRLWQQLGQTRATRANPNEIRFFFLQMWDLKHISIYTLCSQEKSHVFSMWDKKPFGLNTAT